MGDASYAQSNFLGGEWSKYAQGRFDRPDYRTALSVCFNALPIEQGAWTRRPGTRFAQTTRGGQPGRLISFDFKQSAPYLIEFTAGMLRFFNGPKLVTTNDDQVVSTISTANPAALTTAAAHGWSSGNSIQFANLGTGTPLLQNRVFVVTVTGASTFTLADALTGTGIDGSTLGALTPGATVQRILEVPSPYTGLLWQNVRMVQTELQAILLHPSVPPQILTATAPGAGQTFFSFAIARAAFVDGPYLDRPLNGANITPSAISGNVTLTLSSQTYSSTTSYKIGDFVASVGLTYQSLVDQNEGNTPASSPSKWKPISAGLLIGPNGFVGTDVGRYMRIRDSADNWTWGKITAVQNLIDPNISGSSNVGNLTAGGSLPAAFDTITAKTASASAETIIDNNEPTTGYVGKHYGGTPQPVAFATIWPTTDLGFAGATKTYATLTQNYKAQGPFGGPFTWSPTSQSSQNFTVPSSYTTLLIVLRAKQTAPSGPTDGTALGSATWAGGPLTITSNDQTTAWAYVWFEVQAIGVDLSVPSTVDTRVPNPPTGSQSGAGATATVTSSSLVRWEVTLAVAQAQFFGPPGTGSGNSVAFQILGNALPNTTSTGVFQMGAYSDTTGWPSCGTYHEGRLWLAGSIDNRIDGSVSNQTLNFAPTDAAGIVSDASAIAAVFNAPDVNAIFWMVPDQLGIIVGTQAGDWLVQATSLNSPLTPTSMQAHRYDLIGCANIEPRRASGPLIVVNRFRRKLLEYFADVFSGRINAQNVTWQMQHMTAANVAELAFQNELSPVVWARCDDGSLFGITYKRESLMSSQPPNFAAGHRHALGSGRTVESVTVGPSIDGQTDALAMVTNSAGTQIRHVEILTPLFQEAQSQTAAWFLDDAVVPTSTVQTLTTFTLNGLSHLNNSTVTVFAGGIDCGDWPVTNGSIVMTYGDGVSAGTGNGLFTLALIASFGGAMPIVVGFAYNSDGQGVRPVTPQDTGARNGPALAKKRRSMQFGALLDGTAAISFGTSFDKLFPARFESANGVPLTTGQTFSGVYWDSLNDDYSFDGMPCWRAGRTYSATLVVIEAFIQTSDK